MVRPGRLKIFLGDELVGTLDDMAPSAFQYAPGWLARRRPFALGAIPLLPERQQGDAVQAFFENLLPEGELRDYVASRHKASTLFSLLLETAGDTAGAFVIVPDGQHPEEAEYEPTSWEALAVRLGKASAVAIDLNGAGARISLAGAQDKASIALFDGIPYLPRGTAASTHILKPDIRRLAKVWHSAVNETLVMGIAAQCGLPTAEVFYEPLTQSCVVRRFDRIPGTARSLERLIQYDFCQLAGTLSEKKYEKEGGPGVVACADLIRKHSSQPALDLRHFISWLFFNLYVGNNDSHAKNLSVYHVPGRGTTLTPFYDLMCTRLYAGLSPEFAFAIGGETHPGAVDRHHVVAMARSLGMQPAFILRQAADLARKMPAAVERTMTSIMPVLPPGAQPLAEKLARFILSTTKKTAKRLAE
ncbi:MAG: type II toxin-antitoxin system HipA family toxin [Janthinobacterium lividum]